MAGRIKEPTELTSLLPRTPPLTDIESQNNLAIVGVEYKPHSRIIYGAALALGVGNAIGSLPHAYTAGTYASKGATHFLRKTGKDIPELSADYANLTSKENLKKLAHPIAEFSRGGSFVTEFVASVAQFEVVSTAIETDRWIYATFNPPEGRINACKGWFVQTFSSCDEFSKSLFRASSYLFLGVAFAAGTYPTVQQIADPIINLVGKPLGYTILAYLFSSGFSGYVFGYAKGCKRGINYWLKKPTIQRRYREHQYLAIEIQSAVEGGIIISCRIFFSSFSLGELAQQLGLDPASVICFYVAGGISGFFFGAINFVPSTSKNYLNYFEPYEEDGITYDAISSAERNRIYQDEYDEACSCCLSCRAYVEIKRGFPIGYIQAYGTYCLSAPIGGPMVGLAVAAMSYALFCKAGLQKELNAKAHQRRATDGTGRSAIQRRQDYGSVVKQPVVEDSYEPSRCAIICGTALSWGQQFFRIPQNIYSITKNSLLGNVWSKNTDVQVGIVTGGIQGKNRDERFRPQLIDTFAKWGCRKPKVSKQGIFAPSSPQPQPSWWRSYVPSCCRR